MVQELELLVFQSQEDGSGIVLREGGEEDLYFVGET